MQTRATRTATLMVATLTACQRAAQHPDAAAGSLVPAPPELTALVGATVWDGTGAPPVADAVVLLARDRILGVGPRGSVGIPPEARVLDVMGTWIMPGLVDAHVHFFQSAGLYTRPDVIDLREVRPYAEEVAGIRAGLAATFRRYLASGVTAVVDMGGPFWNFEVRDAARKSPLAPHVAVAGPLVSTVARPQLDLGDPPIVRAETPAEARAMARKQLERKPDLVKVWFIVSEDRALAETADILAAVAEEAHQAGVRLAVHATELATARAAVLAGADILVHSVQDLPVDQPFMDLVRERGVLYIPNLVVLEGYAGVLGRNVHALGIEKRLGDAAAVMSWREMPDPGENEAAAKAFPRIARFKERQRVAAANLAAMYAAGVPLAIGTDAGNIGTLHGPSIHRELELMAEAGLPPEVVLRAATSVAARVFAAVPEIGSLAPGKIADLLILEANPLEDVRNVRRIRAVVRGGVLQRPDEILAPNPEAVVQDQVDAYNARDAERFAALYASDAVVARHPTGEVVAGGRDAIREKYAALFAESPKLHCTILHRIVEGRFVIDHEMVTGRAGRPHLRAVAVYEVSAGLIQKAWLARADDLGP